ncbi:hypothetical protein DOK_16643 [gamma proteobacterium BDW918]|uniref:Cthe-2314-like HEPN domain-containing protein n=1 Tax=Zhongshania aliphaticivorans TaxID=1470434 RepID=A0A127M9J6_9GAMM|nr:hypothetical protein [Zhongshania aliphaticivorans]AMO69923.1 hypothetical protein AZF00_17155 [Zhongshania aliphaticivorans]EIF42050.1 hypothetical protein DOK_16643 [gamma proteobacterium BDW918]
MYRQYDLDAQAGAEAFDRDLNGLSYTYGFGFSAVSVEAAFKNYYEQDRLIYYMAVDLKLNLYNLFSTIRELEALRSRSCMQEMFSFHNKWVNFVAVYRSFYDKFMNVAVKAGYPEKYDSFDRARSKAKTFRKIALENGAVYLEKVEMFLAFPEEFVLWTNEFINKINDQYRTAELHGSGKARKWVFTESDLSRTPYADLQDLVNHMGQFINILGCIFSGREFAELLEKELAP